eukprot:gene6186-7410_t
MPQQAGTTVPRLLPVFPSLCGSHRSATQQRNPIPRYNFSSLFIVFHNYHEWDHDWKGLPSSTHPGLVRVVVAGTISVISFLDITNRVSFPYPSFILLLLACSFLSKRALIGSCKMSDLGVVIDALDFVFIYWDDVILVSVTFEPGLKLLDTTSTMKRFIALLLVISVGFLLQRVNGDEIDTDCLDTSADTFRIVFLMEGSFTIHETDFNHFKTFVGQASNILFTANSKQHQVSIIEYSTFPCSSDSRCTPFLAALSEIEIALDTLSPSAGISRLVSAIDYVLLNRFHESSDSETRDILVIIATSDPDQLDDSLKESIMAANIDVFAVLVDPSTETEEAYIDLIGSSIHIFPVSSAQMMSNNDTITHAVTEFFCLHDFDIPSTSSAETNPTTIITYEVIVSGEERSASGLSAEDLL